jgi:hypothetical protein
MLGQGLPTRQVDQRAIEGDHSEAFPSELGLVLACEMVGEDEDQGDPEFERHASSSLDVSLLGDLSRVVFAGIMLGASLGGSSADAVVGARSLRVRAGRRGRSLRSVGEDLEGDGQDGGEGLGGIEGAGQAEPDQIDEVQRAGHETASDLSSGLSEDIRSEKFGKGPHASRLDLVLDLGPHAIGEHRGSPLTKTCCHTSFYVRESPGFSSQA